LIHGRFPSVLAALAACCLLAPLRVVWATGGDAPPRFEVPAPQAGGPLTFVVYGDTRFTQRDEVANPYARHALVARIANEHPAAILIGGDLVFQGDNPDDYDTYHSETTQWSKQKIPVFPALGNHEFKGCAKNDDDPCLENWWTAFSSLSLRPHRWYSVTIGATLLALILDSDAALKAGSEQRAWFEQQITNADKRVRFILVVLHYPPVRDAFYPSVLDEKEVARYFSKKARTLPAQVVVVGSHVHNYERYYRNGVTYLVSGGGGAKPVPAVRLFGERSGLRTSVNYHYLRFTLQGDRLSGTMVRFDAAVDRAGNQWTEPDRFEIRAKSQ
jgi:calcineurin-like phosphoesterase family protein